MVGKFLLRNWLCIRRSDLSVTDIEAMKRELTYIPRYDSSNEEEKNEPTIMFDDSDPDYFKVPVAWGTTRFGVEMKELGFTDETVSVKASPAPKRPNPHHPKVKDPEAQAKFMEDMLSTVRKFRFFIGRAPTGSGKTVVACNTLAELGEKTLIVVHLERLAAQWEEEIQEKLGIPKERIGRIQGPLCDIEDKDVVIAILNSVSMREYPEHVYKAFGLIIYDEVHKVAARVFSRAASAFHAKYRIGLSATPTRKDGADKVIQAHLGPVRVVSTAEALRTKVYAMYYRSKNRIWGQNHGSRVKCISQDKARNGLITKIVKKLYDNNREILVVSDSIDHLHDLFNLFVQAGVSPSTMGFFTGQKYVGDKRVKTKPHELDDVKANSQIILATYNMMKEGIDIPRLDAGVDATPRSEATQILGRIRRPEPDKPLPLWYTIVDVAVPAFVGYYKSRCKDYRRENVEVIEHGTGT